MSILDSIRDFFRPMHMVDRGLTPAQIFNTGYDDWLAGSSASGVRVTTKSAMQAAIGACVRLLADDISTLPIDTFRKVGPDSVPIPLPDWLRQPNDDPWETGSQLISDIVMSLGTDGNTFLLGIPDLDSPRWVEVLDPDTVEVTREGGPKRFKVQGKEYGTERILHIPWVRLPGQVRGISPVQASQETTGLELAAREWAGRFFGNGATLGGVIQMPGARPSNEEAEELRKQFAMRHQGRRKSHAFGVLYGGATYAPVSLKPQEAELAPLWRHVLEEAARIYHIPPHLLGSQDPGGSSYSSVEQRSIEYVVHGVTTFTTRIERSLSLLIPGDDTFLKLNVSGLLRGDIKSRAEAEARWLENKVLTREEVRALEDFRYIGELGFLETPNNNAPQEPADTGTEDERSLSVSVNDAPIMVAPELRIDSVQVSEAGVERIAEASTSGIAAGIAILGDRIADDGQALADTFTSHAARVEVTLREQSAELTALKAQVAEMEAREAVRSQPVSVRVSGDRVYEQRGATVTTKRIQRDEAGKVIGLVAEA